jgi:hypothetical protein
VSHLTQARLPCEGFTSVRRMYPELARLNNITRRFGVKPEIAPGPWRVSRYLFFRPVVLIEQMNGALSWAMVSLLASVAIDQRVATPLGA